MKNLIFENYANILRKDIMEFSPFYLNMIEDLKSKIIGKATIDLCLGRISDSGFPISTPQNFTILKYEKNLLKVKYLGELVDEAGERMFIEKTIRFDNPFGEIPILPEYQQLPKFFNFGEKLNAYKNFITEVGELLSNEIGSSVELGYRNDDGTISFIKVVLKEMNKGNIFSRDFHEILIEDNCLLRSNPFYNRVKNHRFISELGYLFWISPLAGMPKHIFDDGLIPSKSWNFPPLLKKVEESIV